MFKVLNNTFFRFVINGLFATGVHYFLMLIAINILHISLYSLAYAFAFIFAVIVSFWGNKHYVFQKHQFKPYQFIKFVFLYVGLLIASSFMMWLLADYAGYNYNIGFFIALILQFMGGYLGARFFIFYD